MATPQAPRFTKLFQRTEAHRMAAKTGTSAPAPAKAKTQSAPALDLLSPERQRIEDVFASPKITASNFRIAAGLLSSSNMSAADIVTFVVEHCKGADDRVAGQALMRAGAEVREQRRCKASTSNPLLAIVQRLAAD